VVRPFELVRRWHAALDEASLSLRYLAARQEIDGARLALVGYSLGSFLGIIVAAREAVVRALVLAAGGDLPDGTPFAKLIRTVADPLRAVRRLNGRPLLMVNGRWDRTIRPEQAERLFAEANEPKELRWWDAGHYLPPAAIADAAGWLAQQLSGAEDARAAKRASGGAGDRG
jgi:predicted esterase